MKVFRVVLVLLAVVGGMFAVKRLIGRDSHIAPVDPLAADVPLAPIPDGASA